MPHQHVLGVEPDQGPRRKQAHEGMWPDALAGRTKVRSGTERLGHDEGAAGGPPQGRLPPPAPRPHAHDIKGRTGDGIHRRAMEGNVQGRGHDSAVAAVAIEELQHGARWSEGGNALTYAVTVHWVHQPYTTVGHQRV